jgi:ring-1,2-phenylacetyl-CoA epoxidase subunit PaaC
MNNDQLTYQGSATGLAADQPGSTSARKDFVLCLADSALILTQRNAAWCGHGPILEQDIALTNISLDLLGQARNLYQYAATLTGDNCTEDKLAFFRTEREYKNCLLVEQPNGDWGQTILRQFLFSVYQLQLYTNLKASDDSQLQAIAAKAIKEVQYHVKWSAEWVIRLGDGTMESNSRMKHAIENLWMYTGELFMPVAYEQAIIAGVELADLKKQWLGQVNAVFAQATLPIPANTFMQTGGKAGIHTEHLGYILAEMQHLQRTYPGAAW